MLILGIILFGMLIGAAAQLVVGLISGDGVVLRPSGIIGSLAGAIIVTFAWHWWRRRGAESRR